MNNKLDPITEFPFGVDHQVLKCHVIETQLYSIAFVHAPLKGKPLWFLKEPIFFPFSFIFNLVTLDTLRAATAWNMPHELIQITFYGAQI